MSDATRTLRVSGVTPPEEDKPERPKPEDWVRAGLAFALFVLLAVEVISALLVVVCFRQSGDGPMVENLKSVLTLVLSPTVALFGAATGFYYGAKIETKPPL